MDSEDLYQLCIKADVPGFCQEVGRLALGVNTGDAGVINEALQARYDPSAGQRALQDASPVLLASHVPVNAAAGEEEAEDAEQAAAEAEQAAAEAEQAAAEAEQAEPRDAEPRDAEPLDAEPRDAEPRDAEPRDAEPQARAPPDAEPRGPAETSLQLRNLEVEMQVEDRRMLQKRKQHELGLEQQAWRKDPEWRAAYEWDLQLEAKKHDMHHKKKLDAFLLRKMEEQWAIDRDAQILEMQIKQQQAVARQ
jgi:hypothetical protein